MFYLKWPNSGSQKTLFPLFAMLTIYFGVMAFEESFRSEGDLLNAKEVCGLITKYAFDEMHIKGGVDTWRLFIRTDENSRKVYDVGAPYLHKVLQKSNLISGQKICIHTLSQEVSSNRPFLSQIYLDGSPILDSKKVITEYLKSPQKYEINFVIITFILSLLCFIKIKKSRW